MTREDVDKLRKAAERLKIEENCAWAIGVNYGFNAMVRVADAIRIDDEREEATNDKEG